MLELILCSYFGLWWLIFKRFKLLPINLWTTVTTIFIALSTLFVGFLWLDRYQPMTNRARTYAITTPIISEIQGRVTKVHVSGGAELNAGDLLFSVDPTPYEKKLASVSAQFELARIRLAQEENLRKEKAGNQAEYDKAKSEVNRLEAEVGIAQYQLEATNIKAPASGYATQITIRPGQIVIPMPFSQVITFVHKEGPYLVAAFSQRNVEFISEGDLAEVAFDIRPGKIFNARVKGIQPLLAMGTLSASGTLNNFSDIAMRDTVPILLEVDEASSISSLPAGSSGTVAIYTGKLRALELIRKVILRIKSWENWLPFP